MPMFIFILIIAAIVAIFSVQNAAPVTISFLLWTFQGSLAIVILLSVIMGVLLATALFLLPRVRKAMKKEAGQVQGGKNP